MHTLSAALSKPLDGIDATLETIENVQLMISLRLNLDIFSFFKHGKGKSFSFIYSVKV